MVFSQWCTLSLKQKTIDPFVEDSYRITVRRDGSRVLSEIFLLFSLVHYLEIFAPRDQRGDVKLEVAFQFVSGEFIVVDFLHRSSEVGTPCKQQD